MFSKLFIVMTAAVVAVNAQGSVTASPSSSSAAVPSGIPGLTPCILACITPAAAQNGCTSFTNVQCVCTSAQFQADAGACLTTHCSPAEIQSAVQLQQNQCAAASLSATGSGVTPKSVSFTLSGASSTAPASASITASGSGSASSAASSVASAVSRASTTGSSLASTGAASTPTATRSSSSALVVNGAVGAVAAMMAGFLAI